MLCLSVYLKRSGGFAILFCDTLITDFSLGKNSNFLAAEMDAFLIFSLPPFEVFGDRRVIGHLGNIFLKNMQQFNSIFSKSQKFREN
jgi:hypothetical protein